jgi:SP family sugar:H+ symporter-like MFS transporter
MPESPRYSYRIGRTEIARKIIGKLNGVDPFSPLIDAEINEIEEKL